LAETTREMVPALLALEDGTVFRGCGFGASADSAGEIVFNTAITGYQEVLTDPSYRGQIITMTAPEIGNVGVNPIDFESARPWCAGFVVRQLSPAVSSWRAESDLGTFLAQHGIPGIADIDTRAITRRLRETGAQRAVITRDVANPAAAVEKARKHPALDGRDLVREVTTPETYSWDEPLWQGTGGAAPFGEAPPARHHVVAYDFGIKRGILRHLRSSGCKVTVVPASTPAKQVLDLKPDGVFLSNGPGDPAALPYTVDAARELVKSKIPVFGICLGHQILGLALGGDTYKLRFGHHGANHPVRHESNGRVEITSQNHNYAVDADSLSGLVELTHVNLNDGVVEGMRVLDAAAYSVQYHPEAGPGPHDARYLFDDFIALMTDRAAG